MMLKKHREGWGLLLVWLVGSILLIAVWYFYDIQLQEINDVIEQLISKL